jgi:NAD(P)-dependent dehydrogenase (short-subunit alcohol dehydrogenase family)
MSAAEGPSSQEAASAATAAAAAATDKPDQVAIITGSASGIGRGTALAFAALNYRLVLVDKNAERLAETAELCREKSSRGHQVSVERPPPPFRLAHPFRLRVPFV